MRPMVQVERPHHAITKHYYLSRHTQNSHSSSMNGTPENGVQRYPLRRHILISEGERESLEWNSSLIEGQIKS